MGRLEDLIISSGVIYKLETTTKLVGNTGDEFLDDLYEIYVKHSNNTKVLLMASILNACYTSKRGALLLVRDSLKTLLENDRNHELTTFSNTKYKEYISALTDKVFGGKMVTSSFSNRESLILFIKDQNIISSIGLTDDAVKQQVAQIENYLMGQKKKKSIGFVARPKPIQESYND